jgi:hypothetical protein
MNHEYDEMIRNMPMGLDRAVLQVLSYRMGRARAIGRAELVDAVRLIGYDSPERMVRHCIRELRREGRLICSAPGEDGGYYLAETLAEFEEFAEAEFRAKIADMSETLAAMKAAARAAFGEGVQLELI